LSNNATNAITKTTDVVWVAQILQYLDPSVHKTAVLPQLIAYDTSALVFVSFLFLILGYVTYVIFKYARSQLSNSADTSSKHDAPVQGGTTVTEKPPIPPTPADHGSTLQRLRTQLAERPTPLIAERPTPLIADAS
jgi:hypothetical protein